MGCSDKLLVVVAITLLIFDPPSSSTRSLENRLRFCGESFLSDDL